MSAVAKPLSFPELPPGVRIERAEPQPEHVAVAAWGAVVRIAAQPVPDDAQWVLTDAIPHSPSRFILGRYPTIEAAEADAWDRMTAHDLRMKFLTALADLSLARMTVDRMRKRTAKRVVHHRSEADYPKHPKKAQKGGAA